MKIVNPRRFKKLSNGIERDQLLFLSWPRLSAAFVNVPQESAAQNCDKFSANMRHVCEQTWFEPALTDPRPFSNELWHKRVLMQRTNSLGHKDMK